MTVLHYEHQVWVLCVHDASTIVLCLAATLAAYTYKGMPSPAQKSAGEKGWWVDPKGNARRLKVR